jgi:hypothetical protein
MLACGVLRPEAVLARHQAQATNHIYPHYFPVRIGAFFT